MKRLNASGRCLAASALTICTRTVWFTIEGASLPRAIRRILPSCNCWRPNGVEAQPTSIWPDMTWVRVMALAPLATARVGVPKCLINASSVMWVEAPTVEKPALLPSVSLNDLIGESAGTYQYRSPAPVVPAARMRTGAPLANAPRSEEHTSELQSRF